MAGPKTGFLRELSWELIVDVPSLFYLHDARADPVFHPNLCPRNVLYSKKNTRGLRELWQPCVGTDQVYQALVHGMVGRSAFR